MINKELDDAWRDCVRLMYGGRCARCTWLGGGAESCVDDTHHILSRGAFPQYKHHPANGLPLCRPCHDYAGIFTRYFLCELADFAPDVYDTIAEMRKDRGYRHTDEGDSSLIQQYVEMYRKQYRISSDPRPQPTGPLVR